jgi:hypothetical protein
MGLPAVLLPTAPAQFKKVFAPLFSKSGPFLRRRTLSVD